MKLKKYLILPVAASSALSLTSCGDKEAKVAEDTVASAVSAVTSDSSSFVDKSAANFKEGSFSDYSSIIEKAIQDNAGEDLPEGITSKDILDFVGLGNISSYAQSSTPDGTEWINKMRLDNGGDHKGVLQLFNDSKYKDLAVADMAPAGTDLAMQFGINLKSVEASALAFMAKGAEEPDIAEFKKSLEQEVPMLGVTTSELLQKLDLRLNLALDLDPNEQLPTPVGSFDKPNLVLRLDGISWIWDKVGAMAIGSSGLPFQKTEADGITTFSLPAEMAANFMGYSPEVRVDSAKDQIWIASTPDFLAKCTSGTNTLSSSQAYKDTMEGLPTEGQMMSYMSKDFATFISKTVGDLKEKGMLDSVDAAAKTQLDSGLAQLSKVSKGAAQVVSADSTGVSVAERGVQNIEQGLAEMQKSFAEAKKASE